jgi:hypothetical protein
MRNFRITSITNIFYGITYIIYIVCLPKSRLSIQGWSIKLERGWIRDRISRSTLNGFLLEEMTITKRPRKPRS